MVIKLQDTIDAIMLQQDEILYLKLGEGALFDASMAIEDDNLECKQKQHLSLWKKDLLFTKAIW